MPTLEELQAQMEELQRQMKAEQDRIAAEKQRLIDEENAKPVTIKIHKFHEGTGKVTITFSKFDAFLVDKIRWIRGRYFNGNDNIIPGIELPKFLYEIPTRNFSQPVDYREEWDYDTNKYKMVIVGTHDEPKYIVEWDNDTFDRWYKWYHQPDLKVTLEPKKSQVIITPGPKVLGRLIVSTEIQSFTYNSVHNHYTVALAEAHKIPDVLKRFHADWVVEYEDGLMELIVQQLKKKELLLTLANATDAEVENPFINGKDFKPTQRVAVKFAEFTGDKCIIAYPMGAGKTIIGTGIAEVRGYRKVLIVCPATLKLNWKNKIKEFTGKDALVLYGTEPNDYFINSILSSSHQYYIINYDIISRATVEDKESDDMANPWVMLINLAKFDLFIVDEVHRIKNIDSKRSRATLSINMPHSILLSGTPIVNRPGELFPPLHIIDPESFHDHAVFARQYTDGDGNARNVSQLHEILSQRLIKRTYQQIFGEDLIPNRITYDKELSPEAMKNYQMVLEGVYQSLRDPNYQKKVTTILAQLTRCKQICSADNVETSCDLALDAYEETEKGVIIFSQYKESQAAIAQCLGRECRIVNGDVADEERYDVINRFNNGEFKYLATNILEGLDMTYAHTVIFNDLWWTPKDHEQAEGRAFGRTNDPHSGNAYYLQNKNTVDEIINQLLLKKMAIVAEVIDGVPRAQEMGKSIIGELIEHLRNSM